MGRFDSVTLAVGVIIFVAACGVTTFVGMIRRARQRRRENSRRDRRIFVVCERQK